MHRPRDTEPSGLGEPLHPRGDVHALPVNPLALHHHVTKVDADAELHLLLGGDICVAGLQLPLDLDRAGDSLHHAWKIRQEVVTHGVHDPPPVLADKPPHGIPVGVQRLHGRGLGPGHEPAISNRVGTQDGGQLTLGGVGGHLVPLYKQPKHYPPGLRDSQAVLPSLSLSYAPLLLRGLPRNGMRALSLGEKSGKGMVPSA